MDNLQQKKQHLIEYLKELGSVIVAFSAGVDSTFLLKMAHDVLGKKAIAVTISSNLIPEREIEEANEFCKKGGIEHIKIEIDELSIDGFSKNPENRCYICKKSLFTKILNVAKKKNISYVIEGSNTDDDGDYRPGMIAIKELGIKSPLKESNLSKEDIRTLSKELNLPTWNKPSFACLASRFVYGEEITREKLSMVEKAEQKLFDLGFLQFRVRIHNDLARIELNEKDFERFIKGDFLEGINTYFQSLGFLYVTLDLGGYKTGNMNKTINMINKKTSTK